MPRFNHHVFVCENLRPPDDPKGCCASKGGSDLLAALRDKVKNAGLANKVRVNSAGCLGNCARGAALVIYPEEVWYSFVKESDLDEIVNAHLIGGRPVARLLDPMFHRAADAQ